MEQEKNCAFQYAKMKEGIFRNTKIVEDKSELTLDEAKQLLTHILPMLQSGLKTATPLKWLFGLIWQRPNHTVILCSIFQPMLKVTVCQFGKLKSHILSNMLMLWCQLRLAANVEANRRRSGASCEVLAVGDCYPPCFF